MLWFIFKGSSLLLRHSKSGCYEVPDECKPPLERRSTLNALDVAPLADGTPVKTFRTNKEALPPAGFEFIELRATFGLLNKELYAKAVKCAELLHWHEHTRFCGVCGAPMTLQTSISKRCGACGNEIWAQVTPAVIVLISRGDEILMVKAHNFTGNYFGLVAGFVETGENLEETCIREIKEETGLEVKNFRYLMSQAWPYPSVLMVGFTAEYVSGELKLQQSELAAGGWFNINSLPALPPPAGAAYKMIEAYKALRNREL